MSLSKELLIQKALDDFPSALKSSLPLDHFSQFYDGPHFDKLAKQISKDILLNVPSNSELDVDETMAIVNELYPHLQEIIGQWKATNEENKAQCDNFLQSQVDFLLNDFRTSVMIKLVSSPDVGLLDLETFLEGRKIVLIEIFDKLSKPGDPQSIANMKTRLNETLKCVKVETVEKQRLQLEQKTAERDQKVLEEARRTILRIARQLKSDLKEYQGRAPKELVTTKLRDINYYLSLKGKGLDECHPNIYSAVLRTTAEMRNCLDEEDYADMSAEEFAETLHEQLLYDFAGENHAGENSSEKDSSSIGLSEGNACAIPENGEEALNMPLQNEVCRSNENEEHQHRHNHFRMDFVEEEEIKEENNGDEVDQDSRNSNTEAEFIQSEDDVENSEEEERTENGESSKSLEDNLESSRENPSSYKKRDLKSTRSPPCNNSNRRSARVQTSSKSATFTVKRSRKDRQDVVVKTKKPMNDDECFGSGFKYSEDSITDESDEADTDLDLLPQKGFSVHFSKLTGSKSRQTGKRRLSIHVTDNPKTEKITYLYLDKRGHPKYRCNVCNRKCEQYLLKYHGEHCGKSDDPCACKECGKTFMSKANLDTHVRIHTGEKPFKCSKCSERFSGKSGLNRHLRSHIRGTRFHCNSCKLNFISQHRLHDHNKSMHKDKLPFSCRHCDQRFGSLIHLKVHVITHADLRPLRCPKCDFLASIKHDLVRHIHAVHSQSRETARKLANEAAIAYLVEDTKDESYGQMPERKINSLVMSHIIKKANLKLPKGATSSWRSKDRPNNP